MKKIFLSLLALFCLATYSDAQFSTIDGQVRLPFKVRWGDADDSASYLMARGNAIYRDSSGTWVTITTDSCSKWVNKARGKVYPVWLDAELSYSVRASSGNTDSTRILFRVDTRYYNGAQAVPVADTIVRSGRHASFPDNTEKDTVITMATTAGTTWQGTQQGFHVGHGNQVRLCVDSYEAGGATGDTTFFKDIALRFQ